MLEKILTFFANFRVTFKTVYRSRYFKKMYITGRILNVT